MVFVVKSNFFPSVVLEKKISQKQLFVNILNRKECYIP